VQILKSFARHLLGAVLTAAGVILSSSADLTLRSALITLGAAVVPVLLKYVDPQEPAFGVGSGG
jgi:hypothetical protein